MTVKIKSDLQSEAYVNTAFEHEDNTKPNPEQEINDKLSLTDFDHLLPFIGEFGFYQKFLFFLIIPFMFSVAFVYFTTIFLTLTPEKYWCNIPELSHLSVEQSMEKEKNQGQAMIKSLQRSLEKNRFKIITLPWAQGTINYSVFDSTKKLNWVCSRGTYASTAQAIFFVGAICGGLIFGWIADFYGRLPALIITNFIGFIVGVLTAFVNNFTLFCLSRFLIGLAFDNCFTMIYIISLEYVDSKYRTFVANMSIGIFFTLASCLLPWIAYGISNWRYLSIVTSLPSLIGIVLAPWLIPESARWLISKAEFDKATKIMRKIAEINGKEVPDKIFLEFTDNCKKQLKETELTKSKTYSFLDLFKSPRLRRITILLILIWMSITLVFDGHVRNVGSLGLDYFLTFTVACATEFPADSFLTLVLDRWGRRWLAFGTMTLSGLFSLVSTLIPTGVTSASFAIMGRLTVNIAYNIGLQYAAEILPTVVRGQGVAVVHLMGYVACILAPFIVLLAQINMNIPLIILGLIGIFGGFLSLFLPETLNKDLPQSLEDGENFGLNQSFWNFPCIRNNSESEQQTENVCSFRQMDGEAAYLSSSRVSFRGAIRSSRINHSSEKNSFSLHP